MAKKLRSFRVLSCIFAGLTTVAFIVACGSGELTKVLEDITIDAAQQQLVKDKDLLSSILAPSSAAEPEYSSDDGGGDSAGSEPGVSSGGGEQPASSASLPSSSAAAPPPSSSSVIIPDTHKLDCTIPANSSFPAGQKIPKNKMPELKCTEIKTNKVTMLDPEMDVDSWDNAPLWRAPQEGTYTNITVKIDKGVDCQQYLKATCTGSIKITAGAPIDPVQPVPSSPSTPSSSSKGSGSGSGGTSSPSTQSSASTGGSDTGGPCKEGGKETYCKWGSNCYAIDSRYSSIGDEGSVCKAGTCSCTDLIAACKADSEPKKVFTDDKCAGTSGGGSSSNSGKSSGSSGGSGNCASYTWPQWDTPPTDGACHKVTGGCLTNQKYKAGCGKDACSVKVGSTTWSGKAWEEHKWASADVLNKDVTFSGTFNGLGCADN